MALVKHEAMERLTKKTFTVIFGFQTYAKIAMTRMEINVRIMVHSAGVMGLGDLSLIEPICLG